jgi:multidrug efflux pump subunit AcrA (membrane-fusion protein)
MISIACMLAGFGCNRSTPPAPPPPAVLVTEVRQTDVPIYSEWVGTTVGFVNAQVMPRVQGYLLKQDHADGASVKAGQLLFEIDDRPYKDIEVLDAAQLLYPAESALAETQRDQLLAVVNLYKALGGGWQMPGEQVAAR